MDNTCICCGSFKNTEEINFCDYCYPDTCYNCRASDVYIEKEGNFIDDIHVNCSHGCSITIMDYIMRKHFTSFLNDEVIGKVKCLGKIIEMIIDEETEIEVVREPVDINSSNEVIGVHHTDKKEELLENGFDYSFAAEDRIPLRNKAAYAYPNEQDIAMGDKVYFIIPKHKVKISSDRILDFLGFGEYKFPYSKYDELVIDPDELKNNIECNPFYTQQDLLY